MRRGLRSLGSTDNLVYTKRSFFGTGEGDRLTMARSVLATTTNNKPHAESGTGSPLRKVA